MRTPFATVGQHAYAVAMLLLIGARIAGAQTISGRIVAQSDHAPVPGAIVALVDTIGRAVVTKLAEDSGTFSIAAPSPGRYAIRVERVGFRSIVSPSFVVRQGEAVEVPVTMTSEATSLRAIVVNADRRCLVRPQEGVATAQLWNEARKALRSTQLTQLARAAAKARRDPHRFLVRWRTTERDLDPGTLNVLHSTQFDQEDETVQPFATVDPERLARDGYMSGDADSGSTFFAPDAEILLSDRFLDSHCFRLQAPERDRRDDLIGLAFEPVSLTNERGSSHVEVRGVLWLDRATAELRYMDYQYVNLRAEQSTPHAGGLLEFRPLPDGRWIVWRWYIRVPALVRRRSVFNTQLTDWHTEIAKIHENGAEVLEVMPADARRGTLATLRGTVIDSLTGGAMIGVRVFLSGTTFAGVTRADGSYFIDSIPPGLYTVSIIAPRLDSLLLDPPVRAVALSAGGEKHIDLALPSLRTLSSALCSEATPDTKVMIVGVVRDSAMGASGVQVRAEWTDYASFAPGQLRAQLIWSETTSGKGGRYSLCAVPSRKSFVIRAVRGGASMAIPQLPVSPGEVRRVDLVLRKPQ